jgi:hypothetical protein
LSRVSAGPTRRPDVTDRFLVLPVPSQALPDHHQDPLKFPARAVVTLDEDQEHDANWGNTVRPSAHENIALSRVPTHSRDSSLDATTQPPPPLPSALASPRIHGPLPRAPIGGVVERVVDPKSANYGHHRQTSIVHGIQHSRNGSLASPSGSPLSPQIIAAAGAAMDRADAQPVAARMEADTGHPSRAPNTMPGVPSNAGGFPMHNTISNADVTAGGTAQRQHERVHSKTRRDLTHSRSHSARYREDQKTVGEYALHVLFTSVRCAIKS